MIISMFGAAFGSAVRAFRRACFEALAEWALERLNCDHETNDRRSCTVLRFAEGLRQLSAGRLS